MKISNSTVDRIPYTTKGQKFYWDDTVKGFGVRVGQTTKTYIAQGDIRRRTCVFSIGKHGLYSADEARKVAKEALVEIGKGINPNERKRIATMRGITLRGAAELHLAAPKARSKVTIEGYNNYLKRYLHVWLDKELRAIDRKMANELHRKIGKEHGKVVANGAMRAFRAFWNRAMREDETLPICPTRNVDWFEQKRKQSPIPTEELPSWYVEIMAQRNPVRRDINLMMLFTGLRRTDATTVRWEDINFEKKTLHRPNPKGGTKRAFTIPVTDFVIDIFKRRKAENEIFFPASPWVFPADSRSGHLMEPKEGTMKWSAHRLRDTYTTAASNAGLPVYDIEVLTNHRPANSSVTAGYVLQGIEQLRISQQKITEYLLAQIFPVPQVVAIHDNRT